MARRLSGRCGEKMRHPRSWRKRASTATVLAA
jgi:hypothetical protein